jgi:hypothetical protein
MSNWSMRLMRPRRMALLRTQSSARFNARDFVHHWLIIDANRERGLMWRKAGAALEP